MKEPVLIFENEVEKEELPLLELRPQYDIWANLGIYLFLLFLLPSLSFAAAYIVWSDAQFFVTTSFNVVLFVPVIVFVLTFSGIAGDMLLKRKDTGKEYYRFFKNHVGYNIFVTEKSGGRIMVSSAAALPLLAGVMASQTLAQRIKGLGSIHVFGHDRQFAVVNVKEPFKARKKLSKILTSHSKDNGVPFIIKEDEI